MADMHRYFILLLILALTACDPPPPPEQSAVGSSETAMSDAGFDSFIGPTRLEELQAEHGDALVLLDARDPDEYAAGHLPGAISLPGRDVRTPPVASRQGDSQFIFRTDSGSVDIERYEKLLGGHGLTREDTVVVYGNHAGQRDGSVPAMILDWLGQKKVYFLDGVAYNDWVAAGRPTETQTITRPPATYVAQPSERFVWTLDDVKAHLDTNDTVFYDTRSLDEYMGLDPRDNTHGGHIPGAVFADYAQFLDADRKLRPRAEIEKIIEKQGLPEAKAAGKPIVMYCQTSTRVSLPYLILHDLGYDNVAIYDGSWHEYGNREDTVIATENPAP